MLFNGASSILERSTVRELQRVKDLHFISTKGESSGKGHKLMLYFTYTRVWADAGSGLIPSSYSMLVSNISASVSEQCA